MARLLYMASEITLRGPKSTIWPIMYRIQGVKAGRWILVKFFFNLFFFILLCCWGNSRPGFREERHRHGASFEIVIQPINSLNLGQMDPLLCQKPLLRPANESRDLAWPLSHCICVNNGARRGFPGGTTRDTTGAFGAPSTARVLAVCLTAACVSLQRLSILCTAHTVIVYVL